MCRGKAIALDIVRGIMMLHNQCNLAHLDIKSPNILLSGDHMHARVADFGLSEAMYLHSSAAKTVAGTLFWAAPEQLEVSHIRACWWSGRGS